MVKPIFIGDFAGKDKIVRTENLPPFENAVDRPLLRRQDCGIFLPR